MLATKDEDRGQPPSLDLIYSEVKERLRVQYDGIDALDRKAGTILTFSSVIIAVAAGLRFTTLDQDVASKVVFLLFFSLGALLYALTVWFAVNAYSAVTLRGDPEPRPLRDNYMFKDPVYTKRRVLSNLIESFEFNAARLRPKALNVNVAMRLVFLETILLAAALVLDRAVA